MANTKVKTKSKLMHNMPVLILLIIAGFSVYLLPYFRSYYYDAFIQMYGLTNTEMGLLGTAYGIVAMISYFIGGFVADRFSARKLLTISMLVTGLVGYVLLLPVGYPVVFAVHAIWGASTILTFWPALMKAVRMCADSTEQSKAYGFFEGGRGIGNAVIMVAMLAVFAGISANNGDAAALHAMIITYSTLNVVVGILLFIFLKDNAGEASKKFDRAGTIKVLKMPQTWLIICIIFCSYSLNCGYFYVTPYATSVFGASAVFAAAVAILAQWVRPVGAIAAGFLGDRTGPSKVMLIGFGLMILGEAILILIPGNEGLIPVLILSCALMYLSMYVCQSMHYALMSEADYPLAISGTAVGIFATLGYLPEWIIPWVGGSCLDAFPGVTGYKVFFGILIALAIIGFIVTLIWLHITKEKRLQLRAEAEAKRNGEIDSKAIEEAEESEKVEKLASANEEPDPVSVLASAKGEDAMAHSEATA